MTILNILIWLFAIGAIAVDTRFEKVYEFKSARSTYSSGTSNREARKV